MKDKNQKMANSLSSIGFGRELKSKYTQKHPI
jgi:hypothetical protein